MLFPRDQLDAFYGSIERYIYERTPERITYVFKKQRARALARLIAWADDAQGGAGYFVLDTGLSSGWNSCRYLLFQKDDAFPDFHIIPADSITIQVGRDLAAEFTVRFKGAVWTLRGHALANQTALAFHLPLKINPTAIDRYKRFQKGILTNEISRENQKS